MMKKLVALFAVVSLFAFVGCQGKSPAEAGKEAVKAAAAQVPATPDKVVTEAAKAVKEGNLVLVYAMLPDSYQADVQAVVKLVGENMDKEVYEKGFALVVKAVEKFKGDEKVKAFAPIAEAVVKMLKDAKLDTHAGLAAFDVGAFVAANGKAIMDLGWKVAEMQGQKDAKAMLDVTAKLKGEAGEKEATVEITMGGKTEEAKFVKVEGKWIPAEMAEGWKAQIEEAKKNVAEGLKGAMAKKAEIIQMMDGVDKAVEAGQMDQLQGMMGSFM